MYRTNALTNVFIQFPQKMIMHSTSPERYIKHKKVYNKQTNTHTHTHIYVYVLVHETHL